MICWWVCNIEVEEENYWFVYCYCVNFDYIIDVIKSCDIEFIVFVSDV